MQEAYEYIEIMGQTDPKRGRNVDIVSGPDLIRGPECDVLYERSYLVISRRLDTNLHFSIELTETRREKMSTSANTETT